MVRLCGALNHPFPFFCERSSALLADLEPTRQTESMHAVAYVGCVNHTTKAGEFSQSRPNLFDIVYISQNSRLSYRNRRMLGTDCSIHSTFTLANRTNKENYM